MEKVKLMKKGFFPPQPTPIYKQIMMSMIWNASISQLVLAAWFCSLTALVHMLISQTQETEKKSLIS